MFKRVRWFGLGVVAGGFATMYGLFQLRQVRGRAIDPEQLVDVVGSTLRTMGRGARHAWDESQEAITQAEDELRASYLDRRPRLRDVNG